MSQSQPVNRRLFLQNTSLLAAAGAVAPLWIPSSRTLADDAKSPNARLRLGCIGTGDRWKAVGPQAMKFATCVAVCDVDANHAAEGKQIAASNNEKNGQKADIDVYEDYQKILERKDIDVVTIVTPDHWHSKIAIEAMQAGKDIYCEKPLTLTINEGKQIVKVLKETNRVFQVGTQQRTEMGRNFLRAIAMIRDGRIGTVKKVTCAIGGVKPSGVIPVGSVPTGLNWDKWLGQAPLVDYRAGKNEQSTNNRYPASRCHYEFRWWYEYSGGKMTDWGAHHVDIASWAIGMDKTGPTSVSGKGQHPVELKDGVPTRNDEYNVASKFDVTVMCPNDVVMGIVDDLSDDQKKLCGLVNKEGKLEGGNGILFEGTDGVFHVSRGKLSGQAFEALKDKPLGEDAMEKVYGGKLPESHMANFFECIGTRKNPISDVFSHHRAMTVCHLANIAIRLDRKINWDSVAEMITGDDAAAAWMGREQRQGYEINVAI
ncbi:MAG: gfo/Idh/MocA family oxidoreductase [Planctomycetota bacterium]|nr:MAG: gfo/Idh/MocA family oxidoreductase [Planctomycetota bacterium]